MNQYTYILTISCPDQVGIVSAVSSFLAQNQGNIIEAAQYGDIDTQHFFMRLKFSITLNHQGDSAVSPVFDAAKLKKDFSILASAFQMQWALHAEPSKIPTILMVSKLGHCLNDLLFRYSSGLIPIDIRAVVSNHRDFYQLAAQYNIPFYHFPVTNETKSHAEAQLLNLIQQEKVELVVLARYMQVLSDDLCRQLDGQVINIHHSFLPSFKGAKPYYQAHERGVKIIGATAHFVTSELDEGPIIEQDVARVDHAHNPEQLTAIGRDVESIVLSRAVTWYAQHRILRNGNKTVVFK
jgi:formyltetrahydrofolate deformylase